LPTLCSIVAAPAPSAPSSASAPSVTFGQRQFGRAAAVDGRIAAQREAGRAGRHDEQRDAGLVVDRAAAACRDDEDIRQLGVLDHGLGTVELPLRADALDPRVHLRQRVLRLGLGMREGCDARAADDLGQQRLVRRVAGMRDRAAGEHGGQEGLDDEAAAQRLEDDGDVEAAAGEAAVVLAEQRADHAKVGELAPQLGAAASGRLGNAVARLESVLLGDEAVQAVGQHAAVVGVLEVHGVVPFTAPTSSWR
jgi:hypothetical protein